MGITPLGLIPKVVMDLLVEHHSHQAIRCLRRCLVMMIMSSLDLAATGQETWVELLDDQKSRKGSEHSGADSGLS